MTTTMKVSLALASTLLALALYVSFFAVPTEAARTTCNRTEENPQGEICTWGADLNEKICTNCFGGVSILRATLTATPTSVIQGSSSTLAWSSVGATSCTGTGFSTGGATSGSRVVTPSVSTTYTVSCTGSRGTVTDDVRVTVTPALTGSCAPSPTSITTGQSATWTATRSGGTGAYTYSWSGTDSLAGATQSVAKTYSTAGTKTGTVVITSGTQSITRSCSSSVAVTQTLAATCSGTPSTATPGSNVTWTANASGGTGSYTYAWTGTTPISGTGNPKVVQYPATGTKTASVTVTSGTQTVGPISCTVASGACSGTCVTVSNPGSVSCNPSPAVAAPSASIVWTPLPVGFTSTPTYTWRNLSGVILGTGSTYTNSYPTTGNYAIQVSATNGAQTASGTCASVTVGNPQVYILATPDRVSKNATTNVSWSASGVSSCAITRNGVAWQTPTPDASGTVATSTPVVDTVTGQTVYKFTCDGTSDTAIVNTPGSFDEF